MTFNQDDATVRITEAIIGAAIEAVPVMYRAVKVECGYRLDFLVDDAVVVEIKSVECLARVHTAQMITYLKLTGCRVGVIINFNVSLLKDGVRHVDHPDKYWERFPKNRAKPSERRESRDEQQPKN